MSGADEETILNEFEKYLMKIGISDEIGLFTHATSKSNVGFLNEGNTINILRDYIGDCLSNCSKITGISNKIYDRYIDYDDEYVIKVIRRVMVTYAQHRKKLMYDTLIKWKLNSIRYTGLINSKREMTYMTNCNRVIKQNKGKEKSNQKQYNYTNKIKGKVNRIKNINENDYEIRTKNKYYQSEVLITNEANFTLRNNQSLKINKENLIKAYNNNDNRPNQTMLKTSPNHKKHHFDNLSKSSIEKTEKKTNLIGIKDNVIIPYKSTFNKEDKEKLFQSLYNDGKIRKDKLKQMNIEKEEKFNSEYTFKPQLNNRSKSSSHFSTSDNNMRPFYERLQFYDQAKQKNLQRISQEITERLPKPKQCKTSPNRNLITNGKQYRQTQREKRRQMEALILEEHGVTFKPILNDEKNSKVCNSTIIERNKQFIIKKEAKLAACRDMPDKNCTFTPSINYLESLSYSHTEHPNTNPNVNTNSNLNSYSKGADNQIGKRLYQYQSKYMQHLEEKKKEYEETYSFKPMISKNTDEILSNKQRLNDGLRKKFNNKMIIDNNYSNENNNHDIQEEPSQNETEGNHSKINHNININTISSGDNSPIVHKQMKIVNEKDEDKDHISYVDERKVDDNANANIIPLAKCDNTSQKKTKVTISGENLMDDKLLDSQNNYNCEFDGTFQMKPKKGMNNNSSGNSNHNNRLISVSEENKITKGNNVNNTMNRRIMMQNLNYYDNL